MGSTVTGRPAGEGMPAYRATSDAVAARWGTDPGTGLAPDEAAARLAEHGRNELARERPVPAWRRFLDQFRDVLVVLLLVACAISVGLWILEGEAALPYEALAIFAVVLLNAAMGFLQESRARAALSALQAMSAQEAAVIRGGERLRIPAAEVVPGDLLLVEEGDTMAADGRVVESTSLHTAEAALTGESVPTRKDARPLDRETPLADRANMVHAGTTATYGRARVIVTATGMRTEMGRIAGLLEETEDEETPLQRELDRTGRLLGLVVIGIAVVMIAVILGVRGVGGASDLLDVMILGVALAVAAVPEGLPAVVTAVLSIGVQRMAKRNAIVRHLAAVETLGSASVVASDKTGTLTKNEMTVRAVVTAGGRVTLGGTGHAPAGELTGEAGGPVDGPLRDELERALEVAERANNATLEERDGSCVLQGDPTEGALLVAARKAGVESAGLDARLPRVAEIPFSSERKLMSTVHREAGGERRLVVFTKGAPDVLLERCTRELVGHDTRPLGDDRRAAITRTNDALADQALRTLGVAARWLPPHTPTDELERLEHDLVFVGLIGMIDPPRPEAAGAVARARAAGIRPLMITGDHPRTAAVIARELDIATDGRTLSGAELDGIPEDALADAVREVSVYARVKPEHKLRIIDGLRRDGAIVAMTGDGVNDAPALKAADIGVAMGITGTDVSKEAADIILADDNFASIIAAVEEGRAIFTNIRKFLRYLLSSNVGEVMTMFFGVLLASWIGLGAGDALVLPLLATQILWINLVTDGPPALALGVDPPEESLMRRPPRPPQEPVITRRMWRGIALVGVVMASGTLLVLDAALPGGLIAGSRDLAHAQTMAFTTLTLFQLVNVLNARSDERSAFAGLFRNRWLWAAIALGVALQALVVYLPGLQQAFGTVPLEPGEWLIAAAVASSVLWVREADKLLARLRARGS